MTNEENLKLLYKKDLRIEELETENQFITGQLLASRTNVEMLREDVEKLRAENERLRAIASYVLNPIRPENVFVSGTKKYYHVPDDAIGRVARWGSRQDGR